MTDMDHYFYNKVKEYACPSVEKVARFVDKHLRECNDSHVEEFIETLEFSIMLKLQQENERLKKIIDKDILFD